MSIEFLDPNSVHVPPNRQRSKLDIDDLLLSIKRFGVLNPIIVKRAPGVETPVLVAGGRRLSCAKELGIKVPARDFSELNSFEHRCIELEENIKRKDLPWRDAVKAVGEIHKDQVAADPSWTQAQTAEALSLSGGHLSEILTVYGKLDDPRLANCSNYREAYNVLARQAERRTAGIVNEIVAEGLGNLWEEPTTPAVPLPPEIYTAVEYDLPLPESVYICATGEPALKPEGTNIEDLREPRVLDTVIPHIPALPILSQDFLTWDFSIPSKFNLIHVDFPYGTSLSNDVPVASSVEYISTPEVFWKLTDHLLSNIDRFCSWSAHIVFWFSMKFYEQIRKELSLAGLLVHEFPLIWHDSSGKGIAPIPGQSPRQTYQTAFLCSRGSRPLVTTLANVYSCPRPSTTIHPSQKPEPMLKHFFQMLVDSNTEFFDPTAGSGTSLLAAEELGARRISGLELDATHCTNANSEIRNRRNIRTLRGE